VPAFRYRLLEEDGELLGPIVTSNGNWQPGDTVRYGGGLTWEVVRVLDREKDDPDELRGYLVVRSS
jgi:hypothetical protein